jgi:hypothetical protein
MKRREFITLVGGAVAASGPFAASAQQAAMPVIGLLSTRAPAQDPQLLTAFRQGLNESRQGAISCNSGSVSQQSFRVAEPQPRITTGP